MIRNKFEWLQVTLVFLLLISPQLNYGQSLTQETHSVAGEFLTGKYDKTVNYTVGELVVEELENKSKISQGFHQLYHITVDIDFLKSETYDCSVYPNPTDGRLTFQNDSDYKFKIDLFDANGRLILSKRSASFETDFDIQNYAQGQYYMTVSLKNKIVKSFKISKN